MDASQDMETIESSNPVYQAYQILHISFTVTPILAGLDKFTNLLVDWRQYIAPFITEVVSAKTFMYFVGAAEIIVGVLVFLHPRVGAFVVALWLLGIIVNLLLIPNYYDIALRDFGLFLAALSLARLSVVFARD